MPKTGLCADGRDSVRARCRLLLAALSAIFVGLVLALVVRPASAEATERQAAEPAGALDVAGWNQYQHDAQRTGTQLPKVGMVLLPPAPYGEVGPPYDPNEFDRFANKQWKKIFRDYSRHASAPPLSLFLNLNSDYLKPSEGGEPGWFRGTRKLLRKLKRYPKLVPALHITGEQKTEDIYKVVDTFLPMGLRAVEFEEYVLWQTYDGAFGRARTKCDVLNDYNKLITHIRRSYPSVPTFMLENSEIWNDMLTAGTSDECGIPYPYLSYVDFAGVTGFVQYTLSSGLSEDRCRGGMPTADQLEEAYNRVRGVLADYGRRTYFMPQNGNWYPNTNEGLEFFLRMKRQRQGQYFVLMSRIGYDRWDYSRRSAQPNCLLENGDDPEFRGPFYDEWVIPARKYIRRLYHG